MILRSAVLTGLLLVSACARPGTPPAAGAPVPTAEAAAPADNMPRTLGDFTRIDLDNARARSASDALLAAAGVTTASYAQASGNILGVLMLDAPSTPPLADGASAPELLLRRDGMWQVIPRRPNMRPLSRFGINDAPSGLRLLCMDYLQQETLLMQVATCLTVTEGRLVTLSMAMPAIPDSAPRAGTQILTARTLTLLSALREALRRDPRLGSPSATGAPPPGPVPRMPLHHT